MEIINFLIGQLVGLVEPFLAIDFIIKCLGWKEGVRHRKQLYIGVCLIWFIVAQGNGRFAGSYNIIAAFDMCLAYLFSYLYLKKTAGMKLMICILEQIISTICTLSVMQLTAYIINTSVFDFLENEGMIFQTGAIVSKIVVWLVYKGVYTYLDYMTIHFPKEQIVLTNVMIGFTTVSEGCIFLAVSQKGVSHYTVVLLMIVFLGIIALCGYVIYMMITISKKESMRKFRHDYKNHCMNMEHLLEKGEYESLDKYLKQFVSEELGEVRSIYSDSPIINAVFHNKMSICKEKRIDISCNITGSVKCLDDMGVGSILFNLLDNAIEACEKNKKEKRIVCQIAREADEVNIFLENSIDQSVLAENPSFETTKDKKDQHGMGHLIVEEQVKRLGGMVEYYEDEMFCAHIYLPM